MKYLKTYNQLNEGLRDKMRGKSEEDILKNIENLSPRELLLKSAEFGWIGGVKKALDIGVKDVNALNISLIKLVGHSDVDIIKRLLDNGADITHINDYVLRYASTEGYYDVVKLALDRGANIHSKGNEPIKNAILRNHVDITHLLFERGADLGDFYHLALKFSETKNNKEIIDLIKKYSKINEGLRDKMVGPSEEDLMNTLKNKDDNAKIVAIIEHGLDYSLLPRNSKGQVVYNGDFIIKNLFNVDTISNEILDNLPANLVINNGNFNCSGLVSKLPDNLIVDGSLDCDFCDLYELPKGLVVNGDLTCSDNYIEELPDDMIVGGILYLGNNPLTRETGDIRKQVWEPISDELKNKIPKGVNDITV